MEANKFFKSFIKRKNSDESGYAMVLVLGIVILTIGILSSMTLLTVKDVKSSTRNRGVLEARISGESALDSLYAAANANPSQRTDMMIALSNFKSSGGSPQQIISNAVDSGPIDTGNNSTSTYYTWSNYFGIDADGNIVACPPKNTTPCFKIRMIKVVTKPSDSTLKNGGGGGNLDDITATRVEYVADVVTRTKCQPNTVINCSYSRVQQNLSLRKYIEYVSISVKENVAPVVLASANVPNANALNPNYSYTNYYSGADVVNGNIHTNDAIVRSCNNFKSTWITSTGTVGSTGNSTDGVYSGSALCGTGPTTGVKKATRAALALPERSADATGAGLRNIAVSDGALRYVVTNPSTIVFNGAGNGSFTVNGGAAIPMPPSGVLFLDSESSIEGTVRGKITIASKDGVDINIKRSLTYANGSVPGNTSDMIGVYSGKDIKIACNASPATTGRCTDISIDGFLKSRTTAVGGGTIYNPNWAGTVAGGTPPKLKLFGAMESYYRGTFGSIDSQSDQVKTGFQKDFTFDKRLTYQQPPFMLRDGTVPYIRNAVKDVPCGAVCN